MQRHARSRAISRPTTSAAASSASTSTTGEVEDLYTECDGNPLRGPNDIVFDAHGGFWFTDLGKIRASGTCDRGGLYYAKPDGSSITEVVFPLTTPNGVGLSPDGRRSTSPRRSPGRLWAWDVAVAGRARRTRRPRPDRPAVRLPRLPAARLAGRRRRGQRLRGHADHRGDHRRLAPTASSSTVHPVPRVRRVRHQHLLRRRRTCAPRTSRRPATACCTRCRGRTTV